MQLEHSLTENELLRYRAEGFLVRQNVFTAAEVAGLAGAVENATNAAAALAETGKTYLLDNHRFVDVNQMTIQFEHQLGSDVIRVIEPAHQLDPALAALVDNPKLANPIRSILGTDRIALWTDKLNLKRAGGSGFRWHQDSPYWIHDSNHVDLLPNVMVTIDDTTEPGGCFQIIRGSHHHGCLPGTDDGTQLGGFYTNPDHISAADQVSLVVPAGSLIFFSPHLVHGSGPNQSQAPRRAMILTYQPAAFPMLKFKKTRNIL